MRKRSIYYIKDSVTTNYFISGTVMSQDINDARIYLKEKGAKKAQKEIAESFEQVDNASTKSKLWEEILRPRRHLPFYGAVIIEVIIEDCENANNKKSN